ncbi:MAG: Rpn family recombination-promoting nuclease/putative transposase [Thermostichus sp. BF3_bins_97]
MNLMAQKADIGSKRLISRDPDTWSRWVTGLSDVQALETLSSEFQWVSRESDALIKVNSPEHGPFLLLNEIQLHYSSRMPQRMTAYAALARERYNLPVFPSLINILPPKLARPIPDAYESSFLGLIARQDYKTINLWEVEAEQVFRERLSVLLPFVPVLKDGGSEAIVQRAVQELRRDPQLEEFEPLLAFFAGFVLELPLVQEIMRWDMTVLRESPWYEQILQEGEQKGIQEGIQQVARKMLSKGMSVEEVADLTGLEVEQIQRLMMALSD